MLPKTKKLLLTTKHKLAKYWVWMVIMILPPLSVFANEIRPSFKSLRYEENYQFLRDPIERTDLFDSFKYIPLDESDSLYLTLGGETRQHYEFISNNNWGTGAQDDNGYYLQRYLVHGDLHTGEQTRFFVQFMSGVETGREGGSRCNYQS